MNYKQSDGFVLRDPRDAAENILRHYKILFPPINPFKLMSLVVRNSSFRINTPVTYHDRFNCAVTLGCAVMPSNKCEEDYSVRFATNLLVPLFMLEPLVNSGWSASELQSTFQVESTIVVSQLRTLYSFAIKNRLLISQGK